MNLKLFFITLSVAILTACSTSFNKPSGNSNLRTINSENSSDIVTPNRVDWTIASTTLQLYSLVYTPFFVDGEKITLYSGGPGVKPSNGVLKLEGMVSQNPSTMSQKLIIQSGPHATFYDYFRAPRVARNGSELWMLVEVSGCYSGCDNAANPKSLGVYQSTNDGANWNFIDFVKVDGKRYVSKWMAHTGLIYNPEGSATLNLNDLTKNRFITTGESKDILVSADGVNYTSVPMNHPFPNDRLVFASIAKTPYGFHLTSSANWSDRYFTTTVRHLFSKDLVNWYALESNSFLKNPNFYKGVQLNYDEKSEKLWAISPCGSVGLCSFVAWLKPKDYLQQSVPAGEYVYIDKMTAMIVNKITKDGKELYKVRFADGVYKSEYTRDMFVFPLADYQREGCFENLGVKLCVGDTVYVNDQVSSIMGINTKDMNNIRYAIKFANGIVDTGYPLKMLRQP